MIKKKQREYASAQEYITPFLKRYRRVFWFDAFLAFLHLPLLAYLIIEEPIALLDIRVDAGWRTLLFHLSLAGFGIVVNLLLLKDSAISAIAAYLKIVYAISIRGLVFLGIANLIGISFIEIISPIFPLIFFYTLYQGFYGSCVFLYSKWKNQLKENSDNQRVDLTVKTPVESGKEQGTAGHP